MKKIYLLILLLFGLTSSSLLAQKKVPPVFSTKEAQNNFSPQPGKIFVKLGLLNLLHPTAPSLDVGLEYMLLDKLGIEFVYGLRSPQIRFGDFEDRLYFDQYYKLFGSFRFYPKGRGTSSVGLKKLWPNLVAVEGYYSRASTLAMSNFALDNSRDDRLDYASADVDKWVRGLNLKAGYIWKLSNRLSLESNFGLGIIFYRRDYVFFTPNINGQAFSEDLIGPYDDRNMGRVGALNLIGNVKLNYKIL